jgi:hypothetical protein
VLEEQMGRRGNAAAPLEPTLQRLLADIQERLTFRAQAFVREEIAGFQPKPEDLDYPARLEAAAAATAAATTGGPQLRAGAGAAAAAAGEGGGDAEALPISTNGGGVATTDGDAAASSVTEGPEGTAAAAELSRRGWYPPVQRTLLLLSKLYRGVDSRIFNGLAHEAVLAATASVQDAARQILKVGGQVGVGGWGFESGCLPVAYLPVACLSACLHACLGRCLKQSAKPLPLPMLSHIHT